MFLARARALLSVKPKQPKDAFQIAVACLKEEADPETWGVGRGAPRVTILLMWADWDVPPSELLVTGTRGTARIHDGEGWSIRTPGINRAGPTEPVEERFVRQWAAFQAGLDGRFGGPDVAELEPTLKVLERLSDRSPHRRTAG